MNVLMLAGAAALLFAGHCVKTLRWAQLIEIYEEKNSFVLLFALSTGYLVNFFLPLRVGDLARATIAGKRLKNGVAFSLATVIIDRFWDVLSVFLIFLAAYLGGNRSADLFSAVRFYAVFSVGIILFAMLALLLSKWIKKTTKWVCSVFNQDLEYRMLFFFWSLITSFKNVFTNISRKRFLTLTVLMWGAYMSSYALLAAFLRRLGESISTMDVFVMLFSKNSFDRANLLTASESAVMSVTARLCIALYILVPVVVMLVFALIAGRRQKKASGDKEVSHFHELYLLPQSSAAERMRFLETYFDSENPESIRHYIRMNQGIIILRDLSAGSNATTMLCMDAEKTFFRKYAFGDDGEKLKQQIDWLTAHHSLLPLPEIIHTQYGKGFACYDMAYSPRAVGMFQYVHSMPVEQSETALRAILDCLQRRLYAGSARTANAAEIDAYIAEKVEANLMKLNSAPELKNLLHEPTILINGRAYRNLSQLIHSLRRERLRQVFKDDPISEIHGDLTVENMIVFDGDPAGAGFYLIDPNPGNILDSACLDLGKVLQSLHGGYEFLVMTPKVDASENRIDFLYTKSHVYSELYAWFHRYLEETYPPAFVRSVYFHEAVHWLRLLPYKLQKESRKAVLYYAGFLMICNDIVDRFGETTDGE